MTAETPARKIAYETLEGDVVYEGEETLSAVYARLWLADQMKNFYIAFGCYDDEILKVTK